MNIASSEFSPVIVGTIILLASMISLRLGISVAIVEIILGALAGNYLHLKPEEWMLYLANFGGIVLTFLAGTEIDTKVMKEKFKASFLIGFFSFLTPMVVVALYTYYVAGWSTQASLIAGLALSTTSLAVVYSVLVEMNLSQTDIGKLLMASTFVTDMGTAIALSLLFITPTKYTAIFIVVSIVVIVIALRFSHRIFDNLRIKNKVIEPEIKYIFLLLLVLMFFAKVGNAFAILPVFLMGLLMSNFFARRSGSDGNYIKNKLRTVAYAFITPIFFIVGGLKVSFPMIAGALSIFIILFSLKIIAKFIGVYFFAKKYVTKSPTYFTLLMSTGLTFGTISCMCGLNSGIINQLQYSVLVGAVITSAVIPTFIAQKWFAPNRNGYG
ncbi:MAG: cation:proton antiporter [Oligoflexia bacterium]|nr:cation:proton antiporter [Oligoflexia bacterium]